MRLRAYPNPASRQTLIHFETRNGGLVQANVYDLVGRRVRGLTDGIVGAGAHDLFWNGHGDDGRAAPAGVYLVRVSTTEGVTTGRFVIVR
jgi:flagellar hook assembly protein FlgD